MQHFLSHIVLVRPKIAENVGFVARSMTAFGFDSLILVAPEFEWNEDSPAYKTACGSRKVLQCSRTVPSLTKAVEDCQRVIGFTRRYYKFKRPQIDLESWLSSESFDKRIALVFGSENFGLLNEDKHLCDCLVSIPLAADDFSLNLSHAVTVILYELSKQYKINTALKNDEVAYAAHADIQRTVNRFIEVLDRTEFFKSGRRDHQIEILRCLIQRLNLSIPEYEYMMGLLKALGRKQEMDSK